MHKPLATSTLFLLMLLLALFFLSGWCCAVQVNLISDTHYDPAYGLANAYGPCIDNISSPPLGTSGCDAPKDLITSLCTDMTIQNSTYTYLSGDLQRHHFDVSGLSLNDTFDFLSQSLAAVHSSDGNNTPKVVAAMGNNDMVPNYTFNTTEGSNVFISEESGILQRHNLLGKEEAQQFEKCAYYIRIVSPTLRVIVLHTLIWCFSLKPSIPDDEKDPCGQFEFLSTQLEEARLANSKVIILSHIPPYINVWGVLTAKKLRSVKEDMYWKPNYQSRYNTLMKNYSSTVMIQLFGHTHLFSLQALENGVPSYVIPAVTPIYKNIPSYMVAQFDDNTWGLNSLMQRFLSNSKWSNGLRVEDVFGNLNNISSIRSAAKRLITDNTTWAQYVTLHGGGVENHALFPGGECDSWCRTLSACSMFSDTWNDIQSCMKKKEKKENQALTITLVVLGVLVIMVGSGMLFLHYRRQVNRKRVGELVCNDETPNEDGTTNFDAPGEENFDRQGAPEGVDQKLPPPRDGNNGQ
ncbi:beta-fructofuranosidase-like protein [Trypanosoma theileri]|uniref:Beta-fructofuranosidase-like protein n=1 Tax=Trypanosoma theileri TaxID=67003 RepID=A0A1X0PAC3_9TRYP|nr:beta-fructofuranosidase-like protein [Trypanosoma theileri]ORC93775.1 beta-fructofuranosidase-like protein [Trypanosoma theileri]